MNRQLSLFTISAAILILVGLTLYSTAFSPRSLAQHGRKSLDIVRHADEPLDLIDLKVGTRSLKAKIKSKFRQPERPSAGLDNIEFDDIDDWFKRLNVSLRNKSGRRITGLTAYLYLRPPNGQRLFSVTLTGISGELEHTVLEPGDEVQIIVDEASLNDAIMWLRAYGGDPNTATASLSVEMVAFDDGRMWNRGSMVGKDRKNPMKWIPVPSKSRSK